MAAAHSCSKLLRQPTSTRALQSLPTVTSPQALFTAITPAIATRCPAARYAAAARHRDTTHSTNLLCRPTPRTAHLIVTSAATMGRDQVAGAANTAVKGKVLISVSDKAGLPELAAGLVELGYELVSTGGSAAAIEKAGLPVTKVEQLTNFPEMLDGLWWWCNISGLECSAIPFRPCQDATPWSARRHPSSPRHHRTHGRHRAAQHPTH